MRYCQCYGEPVGTWTGGYKRLPPFQDAEGGSERSLVGPSSVSSLAGFTSSENSRRISSTSRRSVRSRAASSSSDQISSGIALGRSSSGSPGHIFSLLFCPDEDEPGGIYLSGFA